MIKSLAGHIIYLIFFLSMIIGFVIVFGWTIWSFQSVWITLTALAVYVVVIGLIHRFLFPKRGIGWIMEIFNAIGN